MKEEVKFLTENSQILTDSCIYTAFLFENSIESWYGIMRFDNNIMGNKLHSYVLDFIFDNDLKVVATTAELFLDLANNMGDGILPFNFNCWPIKDYEDIDMFKGVFYKIKTLI